MDPLNKKLNNKNFDKLNLAMGLVISLLRSHLAFAHKDYAKV